MSKFYDIWYEFGPQLATDTEDVIKSKDFWEKDDHPVFFMFEYQRHLNWYLGQEALDQQKILAEAAPEEEEEEEEKENDEEVKETTEEEKKVEEQKEEKKEVTVVTPKEEEE